MDGTPAKSKMNVDTSIDAIGKDLTLLNYEYLRLVRECAKLDIAECAVRFGADQDLLEQIIRSSTDELKNLARRKVCVFRLANA